MKIYKFLTSLITASVLMFGLQSCFQDLDDDPPFNYPEMPSVDDYNPMKLALSFENSFADKSIYNFQSVGYGKFSYTDGISGKAYKGAPNSYVLTNGSPEIESVMIDTLSNMEEFTVAFWINSPKETGATGIFSIPNTTQFWGNFDIFQDNSGSATQALFKIHLLNSDGGSKERWIEIRMDDAYDKWMHLAFSYDGNTSTFKTYRNGAVIDSRVLDGMGKLKFQDMGRSMVIGSLQFQTTPSQTTATSGEEWGRWFEGQLDEFKFYNSSLSDGDIKALFDAHELPETEEPTEPEVPELKPQNLKINLALNNNSNSTGLYPFSSAANGDLSYIKGVDGNAVKFANSGSYLLMNAGTQVESTMQSMLQNLDSYSAAFWINTPQVTSAGSIFCIPNTATEFGNLDIFMDNAWEDGKALFKVRMSNYSSGDLTDKWAEFRLDFAFEEWTHLTFVYDGETSKMSLFQNGALVNTLDLQGFGKLKFENMSPNMTLGAFQFHTSPSLTSVGAPDWAKWFNGSIDDFKFYNGVLSKKAVKELFENRGK